MEVEDNVAETIESFDENKDERKPSDFKKPLLVGKVGRLPKKVNENVKVKKEEIKITVTRNPEENNDKEQISQAESAQIFSLPYKCPAWSGFPKSEGKDYGLEVLKTGKIIEQINLMDKAFWVFGRLENCDISMAHPTVSRYHAVLQYKETATEDKPSGFYLYDLNSTHGTFVNKNRVKPQVYVRVQVGHLITIGCSTRHYILTGPEEDAEEESEYTVTELKKIRDEKILQRQKDIEEAALKAQKDEEERQRKLEETGVSWGMGDDADEESDLSENPFAQTNNEELYLDDPKKALRGFMEREGFDLEYDCSEQGMGQFLCKVTLPLDDEKGRPIIAEVLHKGKKKEAVVQCALEACRILDRHGVLRQANHESRKRKAKNWEENDYYDSDDDTYLDRTGTVEKKRENRMKAKLPQQAETYKSLLEKESNISDKIKSIERQLTSANDAAKKASQNKEEDSLDSFMKALNPTSLDKEKISKLKQELVKLKTDHAQIIKMVNIARPVDLPPLVPQYNEAVKTVIHDKKGLPLFGKRKKVYVQLPEKPKQDTSYIEDEKDSEEEKEELVEEAQKPILPKPRKSNIDVGQKFQLNHLRSSLSKFKNGNKFIESFEEIMNTGKKIDIGNYSSMISDVTQQFIDAKDNFAWKRCKNSLEEIRKLVDNECILLKNMLKACDECKEVLSTFIEEIDDKELTKHIEIEEAKLDDSVVDVEKRKKKNQRRIQQRSDKAEIEKQKGYKEDAGKEDYNMWIPPEGQSGDGRTRLNEKLGY